MTTRNEETQEPGHPLERVSNADEAATGLLDITIALAKHKALTLGLPLLCAVAAAVLSLLLPNIYTATTLLLPPQQQQSSTSAFLGQLGALYGVGGVSLGIKNPADLYVGMLRSRSIADRLVSRFDLMTVYDETTHLDTLKALESATRIRVGKDGIISVSVDDNDPRRAAAIANAYVSELDKLTQSLAIGEAGQRRLFFERQLRQTKEDLVSAEIALRKTQETSGLIQLEDQAKAIITSIANLKAQLISKEAELAVIRTYSTRENPDYVRAQQQISGLRSELEALQRKHKLSADSGVIVPSGNLPAAGLDYVRAVREAKFQESLFEFLAKQYELAKIDEAKDSAMIQVIDVAVEPDKKSKPRRFLITLLVGFAAAIAGSLLALIKNARDRAAVNPSKASRFAELERQLMKW